MNPSRAKLVLVLLLAITVVACSFGYEVVIVNESDEVIEVFYETESNQPLDTPFVKSLEDWNSRKGIHTLWEDDRPWSEMPSERFSDVSSRGRIVKVGPREVVKIETGSYSPQRYEEGRLSDISTLKIVSPNGEIQFQGKLLLNQFQKDGYTFYTVYRDEIKEQH